MRAVVRRQLGDQCSSRFHRRPMLSVDLHIRTAETVDRLHLVADRAQVLPRHLLNESHLQRVGVLELVDHHDPEPLAIFPRYLRPADQQVDRSCLQVLEVEYAGPVLELPISACILDHEFAQYRRMIGSQRSGHVRRELAPCAWSTPR